MLIHEKFNHLNFTIRTLEVGISLILENNIVINGKGKEKFVVVRKRENTEVQIRGNKFIGKGRLAYEAGNERLRNRAAAGLEAYPALPAACAK